MLSQVEHPDAIASAATATTILPAFTTASVES
jgi:hypothetical protein